MMEMDYIKIISDLLNENWVVLMFDPEEYDEKTLKLLDALKEHREEFDKDLQKESGLKMSYKICTLTEALISFFHVEFRDGKNIRNLSRFIPYPDHNGNKCVETILTFWNKNWDELLKKYMADHTITGHRISLADAVENWIKMIEHYYKEDVETIRKANESYKPSFAYYIVSNNSEGCVTVTEPEDEDSNNSITDEGATGYIEEITSLLNEDNMLEMKTDLLLHKMRTNKKKFEEELDKKSNNGEKMPYSMSKLYQMIIMHHRQDDLMCPDYINIKDISGKEADKRIRLFWEMMEWKSMLAYYFPNDTERIEKDVTLISHESAFEKDSEDSLDENEYTNEPLPEIIATTENTQPTGLEQTGGAPIQKKRGKRGRPMEILANCFIVSSDALKLIPIMRSMLKKKVGLDAARIIAAFYRGGWIKEPKPIVFEREFGIPATGLKIPMRDFFHPECSKSEKTPFTTEELNPIIERIKKLIQDFPKKKMAINQEL